MGSGERSTLTARCLGARIENDFQVRFCPRRLFRPPKYLMKPKSILDLEAGDSGLIGRILGKGSIRQRLLDMGLLPKQKILLKRKALGGGMVWIELNGSQLALRREEASVILMSSE